MKLNTKKTEGECECDTRNALRKDQRAVLAKLSKGGNNAKT
jgi:hypothetical protein